MQENEPVHSKRTTRNLMIAAAFGGAVLAGIIYIPITVNEEISSLQKAGICIFLIILSLIFMFIFFKKAKRSKQDTKNL